MIILRRLRRCCIKPCFLLRTQEGVASATVGHWGIETLQENIRIAQEYVETPVAQVDREELENRLASYAGPHALCWTSPGYRDGAVVIG